MSDFRDARVLPRTLAGATVLQVIPSLADSPTARTAIDVAHALLRAGARSIIASEDGELVTQLKATGGEWLPFPNATFNVVKLRRNVELLQNFVATERVDIVHVQTVGGARSALMGAKRLPVLLVTTLPDIGRVHARLGAHFLSALGQGDRIITHSVFHAKPMVERYRIPPERIAVVPRSIDTSGFDPTDVSSDRVLALRNLWGIPSGVRMILVPGRIAPWEGQLTLTETARRLADAGALGFTFVLAGDDRRNRGYVRRLMRMAEQLGVAPLFRIVGECKDMPAAYAAADLIVVPSIDPRAVGRAVIEAQAMARPVVASEIGSLPEKMLVPPRIADELRTGWLARPGDPAEFAAGIAAALTLDAAAYRSLAARAREYAQFGFSPSAVAAATLAVYTSLLEGG